MEQSLVEKTEEELLKQINKPDWIEILLPVVGGAKYIYRTSREMKKKGLNEWEGLKYDSSLLLGLIHGSQLLIGYLLYSRFCAH